MKIQFKAHQEADREIELSQQELFQLFEIMKGEFENHITYASFKYQNTECEKNIAQYCESYGVDVEYDKDRIAFFTAILDNLKNPYQ